MFTSFDVNIRYHGWVFVDQSILRKQTRVDGWHGRFGGWLAKGNGGWENGVVHISTLDHLCSRLAPDFVNYAPPFSPLAPFRRSTGTACADRTAF